ncbi:MAG TPA: PA domain-containing protein [Rudaea sp.]|nr:PA domain-containing protein [Rudaea sp.]
MRNKGALLVAVVISLFFVAPCIGATTIVINNKNVGTTGFNDPTVVVPVDGNPGVTLGQQRLNVFQRAADQWAALLNSNVTIVVDGSMVALTCTATSATLGSAGPLATAANFPSAPRTNTSYNIAEANALAGSDLDPTHSDIQAQFNVTLDSATAGCLNKETWWYGLDPGVAPPANTIPLLPVVFHELGHGLGFTSNVSTTNGTYLTGSDVPVWANYLFDTSFNATWKNLSASQRLASSTNDPFLVWTGPRTNKQAGEYLKPSGALLINGTTTLPTPDEVGTASFGSVPPPSGITGDVVYVDDGDAAAGSPPGTVNDGCETPFVSNVSGKIALIDRGLCSFAQKAKNAQTQGAIAVVIANNTANVNGLPLGMSGTDATITIPAYSISQAFGTAMKTAIGSGTVNVTLGYANIGVHDGCIRMFAPSPLISGSSVSHFHADATPDLLMEPSLNTTLFNTVDLTLPFFADIDWSTNSIEDFIYTDNFGPNVCQHVQP